MAIRSRIKLTVPKANDKMTTLPGWIRAVFNENFRNSHCSRLIKQEPVWFIGSRWLARFSTRGRPPTSIQRESSCRTILMLINFRSVPPVVKHLKNQLKTRTEIKSNLVNKQCEERTGSPPEKVADTSFPLWRTMTNSLKNGLPDAQPRKTVWYAASSSA